MMDVTHDGPVLVLAGDFDVRSTSRVRPALYDQLAEHADVTVDMTDVSTVDVVALRVLAAASRQAQREGRHVSLRGCNGPVRRMLHLTHLIRLLDVEREPIPA